MSPLIHQALMAALLLALAALERQYREQEQRYRDQIDHIDRQAQQELATAHAARHRAAAAGQCLQQQACRLHPPTQCRRHSGHRCRPIAIRPNPRHRSACRPVPTC